MPLWLCRRSPSPSPPWGRGSSSILSGKANAPNNLQEIDFPGGTTKTYDYDRADRVTHIQASDDPSDPGKHVDLSWDYTVDEAGTTHQTALRQQMIDHKRDITTTYGYDYLGRLVSAEESGSGSDEDSWTYTYNEASELTESTHAKDGSPTITHTYEHRNSHEIKSRDGDTYTYDPQGNLTQIENGPTLSYNEANQTRQLDPANGAAVDFAYAGPTQADRRSRDEASGDQLDYLPNALGLGAQTLTPATGSPESTYFTRMPSGEPVAMRTPQGTDYYVSDSIGSIVAMVDNSGNLAGQYRYDPYGNTLLATEQTQNPYRYAGYYYDHPTGLYKAGERYYDPETASWTQKDPISQIADPRQANPYAYAGADPVNSVDPGGSFRSGYVGFSAGVVGCGLSGNTTGIGVEDTSGCSPSVPFESELFPNFGLFGVVSTGEENGPGGAGVTLCSGFCLGLDTDTGLSIGVGLGLNVDLGL